MDKSLEKIFQQNIIDALCAQGWQLGKSSFYNRKYALYTEDTLAFIQTTQAQEWQKFTQLFPENTEQHFLEHLTKQLQKADPNAVDKELRTFGTLGVLRHGLRIRNCSFSLCQFKPEHELNPDIQARYQANCFRLVPELVYNPYATAEQLQQTGEKAKAWRIDLVLFLNGLPIATLELKSEFQQNVDKAISQYKTQRLPVDPETGKSEPLLTFKQGALVHFAVSQYEVYMTTRLEGSETNFLPFNKGTKEGGKGNDVPEDINQYATQYLWDEVLYPETLLEIIGRFIHLEIKEKEDATGRKQKQESMIFPRYHQWDVVKKLIAEAKNKGAGYRYLIQHSAGSGKSNSIAWTAHQLATLHNEHGEKQFHSVIVVTDRTVLDDQLQDTIYQFEHEEGMVAKITHKEGSGSKSEKLANALKLNKPIIIVTVQTFPYVLDFIEKDTQLKGRRYAIIADEAHSSQTGKTANKVKDVLLSENHEEEQDIEDKLNDMMEARRGNANLNYYAFTATPKPRTLELFGILPNPMLPPSKKNKPYAFHVYSMRQAIEEGFILDVLRNYTSYKVAYKLARKIADNDYQVDGKKAKIKLNQWVRLQEHNIAQKTKVVIEHFKDNIMDLLAGQAKAMLITSSRKEAVRYKLAFDRYIQEKGYANIQAIVAFSGEVCFTENDPDSAGLLGEKFTETNMNPSLKGRDMRKAFDTDDYQVMLVANKFQTGFDQPKLCAMYVDKKLGGVDCVQTLSRLNRTYPGKKETGTFIIDFCNDPQEIKKAFLPYYQTAELIDVSDPDIIFDLFEKLKAAGIFQWTEVEQFCQAFFDKNKSSAAISNICKPAIDRWQNRYSNAVETYKKALEFYEHVKNTTDDVIIDNAQTSLNEAKKEKDRLEIFKKDLGSFSRFYEFMSQLVNYEDIRLEKLNLYARYLRPLLKETPFIEEIDLSNVQMTHYRLARLKQQDIKLKAEEAKDSKLPPTTGIGTGSPKDQNKVLLSEIIARFNSLFSGDQLTENDTVSYFTNITNKLEDNPIIINQLKNNTKQHVMLGDFPKELINAMFASGKTNNDITMTCLKDPKKMKELQELIYAAMMIKIADNSKRK
ncbi:Type I site-specific restriction-modification system, R subunit or related helicase [Snodgrassella alvi SCGC AB-598-P14]|nr:Type I site-specific restriction-modification system, R subunit or related helicase [Snodgrassella alvi SCGC AB-598-P14]